MKKYVIDDKVTVYKSEKEGFECTLLMYVDLPDYEDQVFVLSKKQKTNLLTSSYMEFARLFNSLDEEGYVYEIDEDEESDFVSKLPSIANYVNTLQECGFTDYYVSSIITTEENADTVRDLVRLYKDIPVIINGYVPEGNDKNNNKDYVLYIILRNDISRTASERVCDVAELTAKIASKYPADVHMSTDWENQVVILSASAKDLFVDNIIENKYDNEDLVFASLIKSERKVGHANYALDEAQVVGIAYFGIKQEVPKFVRKLPLWRF